MGKDKKTEQFSCQVNGIVTHRQRHQGLQCYVMPCGEGRTLEDGQGKRRAQQGTEEAQIICMRTGSQRMFKNQAD